MSYTAYRDLWKEQKAAAKATVGDREAMRFNTGKVEWSLVDFKALEPMVQVLMYGAQKYEPDNWKKGLPEKKVIESLLRHVFDMLDGQDNDIESGLPHIGHVLCNAMFISYFRRRKAEEMAAQAALDRQSVTETA